jgi:hypothetical protein
MIAVKLEAGAFSKILGVTPRESGCRVPVTNDFSPALREDRLALVTVLSIAPLHRAAY